MADPAQPLKPRNVEVFGPDGEIIAGFWQYGRMTWSKFYLYLDHFVRASSPWIIKQMDTFFDRNNTNVVQPGDYQLISVVEPPSQFQVRLEPTNRKRSGRTEDFEFEPEYTRDPELPYHSRTLARDRIACLITGPHAKSALAATHIYSSKENVEWSAKGYASLITDPADKPVIGPSKIHSVQNLITLRKDLSIAWECYEMGVNPKDNYRVTAFLNGLAEADGKQLKLDHIHDLSLRSLDELLMDHFEQCLYRYMMGKGDNGDEFGNVKSPMPITSLGQERLDPFASGLITPPSLGERGL